MRFIAIDLILNWRRWANKQKSIPDSKYGLSEEDNNTIPGFGLLPCLSVMWITIRLFREDKWWGFWTSFVFFLYNIWNILQFDFNYYTPQLCCGSIIFRNCLENRVSAGDVEKNKDFLRPLRWFFLPRSISGYVHKLLNRHSKR